jgi:hypothetical protein
MAHIVHPKPPKPLCALSAKTRLKQRIRSNSTIAPTPTRGRATTTLTLALFKNVDLCLITTSINDLPSNRIAPHQSGPLVLRELRRQQEHKTTLLLRLFKLPLQLPRLSVPQPRMNLEQYEISEITRQAI